MGKDYNENNDNIEELSVGEIFSDQDNEDKEIARSEKKAKKKALKDAKKLSKAKKKANSEENTDEVASTEERVDNSSYDAVADGKSNKKRKKKKTKKATNPEDINIVKELLSLIIYIGIVVIACFLVINFVGCRSRVDGTSMEPTLNDGDNLWVDKLAYSIGDPERFDIIIFNYDENTTYVKRIIGLPGETVRIDQNGNIYINEMLLNENYGLETIQPTNLGRASQTILLGEDEYFVLGDNRNNSQDSRSSSVGNVAREDIVGKALIRIYPLNSFGIVK